MDRYIEVEIGNYATGTVMFLYSFRECEPQRGDIIKEGKSEYLVISRQWVDGKLCLLVSNAGVVKDSIEFHNDVEPSSLFVWNKGG